MCNGNEEIDKKKEFKKYINKSLKELNINIIEFKQLFDDYINNIYLENMQDKECIRERANYLKQYLSGSLYPSEELNQKYKHIQIEHVDEILERSKK